MCLWRFRSLSPCDCSILLRAVWRRGVPGNVVVVKHTLTSAIKIGRGRTIYLRCLFAYISWWCRIWGVVNIACGRLSDLVSRACRSVLSKLSGTCSVVVISVVPTSAMTMIAISVLDAVRTENSSSSVVATRIIKTASVCHWLIRLHSDILERAHYWRVCFLELLKHFHAVLSLLELAW